MGNDFDEDHRAAPPESWAAPFRKSLSLRGRPEARAKWYFIWARRFAVFLSGRSLHLATREDAEGFLTKLASSPGIDAWQVEQATDALTILLGDRLMLRVGPEGHETALSRPHARAMDFTGMPMKGLVYVEPEGFASPRDLKAWINKAMEFALSLPAK